VPTQYAVYGCVGLMPPMDFPPCLCNSLQKEVNPGHQETFPAKSGECYYHKVVAHVLLMSCRLNLPRMTLLPQLKPLILVA